MMRSTLHRSAPSQQSEQLSKPPGRHRWSFLFLGIASACLTAMPVRAAEQIVLAIDQLEFYLPVSSLETYAKTGRADADLAAYLRFLKPEAQAKFRTFLQTSRQRTPLEISQFLYSPMGSTGLRSLGDLVQMPPQQNGFYGLRAAMIQSAASPEGLSLLSVIKNFPAKSIRTNVPLALQVLKDVSREAKLSRSVLQAIQGQAKATAAREPVVDTTALPSIQNPGPYAVSKQTLPLVDSRRNNRPVTTDLYIPDFKSNPPNSIPVVVFSHGLGETRTFTSEFQKYLASYGFVVAAPEHIGSDAAQEERLLSGASSDIFLVSEFYDRPQDVSFVLDTLAQKNATEFNGRLNLNRVAVYGHSFGGYTVLALGGATVDFKRLQEQCQGNYLLRSLNPSYLLQCRALELKSSPQAGLLSSGQLRDPRVQLVAAISPVGSAMFGPSGMGRIQVPTLIFGGSDDPAAPYVAEQVEPFSWLTGQDKYLVVANDVSHTPEITEKIDQVILPDASAAEVNARLEMFLKEMRGIGLALMQVYVAEKPEYSPYLLSSYTQTLRNPPFDFSLIRSFPPDRLQTLERQAH